MDSRRDFLKKAALLSGAAGMASVPPPSVAKAFAIDPAPGTTAFIDYNGIESNHFQAMRIRILQGSTITDTSTAAGQVVVKVIRIKSGCCQGR